MKARAAASPTLRPVRRAGEADEIDPFYHRGSGRSVAFDHLQHGGDLGDGAGRFHQRPDEARRYLGRLHQHRAAGGERGHGIDHRKSKRKIPRADHADEG
jgi:hypothetical protein